MFFSKIKLHNLRFFKNITITYIVSLLNLILSYIILVIILKNLGVNIYGKFIIINSSIGFLLKIVSIRTEEAVVRFIKYEINKNNFKKIKLVLFLSFVIDIFTGILFLLMIICFSKLLALWFLKDCRYFFEINLFALASFFTVLRGTSLGLLLAFEKFKVFNILALSEQLIKVLALIFIIYIFNIKISLRDLIYIYMISIFIITLIYLFIFFRFIQNINSVKLELNKNWFREYTSFVMKTFTSTLLKTGNQKMDFLILGYFTDTSVVGFYDILKKIFSPILLLSNVFSTIFYPQMVRMYAKNENIKRFIFKQTIFLGLLFFLYSIMVFLFKNFIFTFLVIENNLRYFYPIVLLTLISTGTQIFLWWVRSFSNIVNPNYSIISNFIASLTYILIILVLYFKILSEFSLEFLGILLTLPYLIVSCYWIYIYYSFRIRVVTRIDDK